jgi:fructoselysine/glucoselysine PTS system EIIC component
MIQALLLGIIGFIANCDYALGTSLIKNPIVTGPLVGLVMGDLTQGVIIGGVLELAFIGAQSVGAFVPPNVVVGGVLGTAFAISTGSGAEVAVTLAYPIALLAAVVENVFMSFIFPIAGTWADKYAAEGDYRKIELIHMGGGLFSSVCFGALCTLGFMLGSAQVEAVVNAIPAVITDGLTVATGILPAMGFAMLAQMTVNKKVVVFFAIGFVLSSYMGVPVLGIAILGVAAAILQTGLLNGDAPAVQAAIDGGDDDDF